MWVAGSPKLEHKQPEERERERERERGGEKKAFHHINTHK
jgi:hypothetical protein